MEKIAALSVKYVKEAIIAAAGLPHDPIGGFLPENVDMGKRKIVVFQLFKINDQMYTSFISRF